MASGPITSWQIDGETVETVSDFIFLGFKTTADSDCSWEIKRHLLLRRKAVINLNNVLNSRDISLPTKICIVKAKVYLVVMYRYENWIIRKAEHWRIDTFELWCWRRLLRAPRTARKSNQSILQEIYPEYSLEGLMLKLQYFGHLMWRADTLENTLMMGKWMQEEKVVSENKMIGWHHRLKGHESEQTPGDSEGQGSLTRYSPWGHKESDITEQLKNSWWCNGWESAWQCREHVCDL